MIVATLLWAAWLLLLSVSPAHAEPITIALFGAAFANTIAGTFVTAAISIGVSLALSGAASLLLGGGGAQRQEVGEQQQSTVQVASVQIPERAGLLDEREIYGRQVVSGGVFFQQTIADSGSTGPDVYVLGFAIANGVIDAIESVIINGIECTVDVSGNPQVAPWYNTAGNFLKVSFRSGQDDQAIDPIILARWPTPPADFLPDNTDRLTLWPEFRQRGVATVVVEMKFGADAEEHTELWGVGGIPDIKFKVRGRTVYDPRDTNQDPDDPDTWEWSNNATLIQADWLRRDIGFAIASAEIDWDSVRESADIDDEWVVTLDGIEHRGTINGVVSASEVNDTVLGAMALSNRAVIRRAFGQYTIRSDRPADPVATIHDGLLVGDFTFQNEPDTRSALNTVKAQFLPASHSNQSGEIEYQDATLLAADGQEYSTTLGLRYIDSPAAAQRLSFAAIKENRVGRTLQALLDISVLLAPGKPNGQMLQPGDVVRVDFEEDYDALNGLYTVVSLEIGQDYTVGATLVGFTTDIINGWSSALETPYEEAA